jgi:hypothetical protein
MLNSTVICEVRIHNSRSHTSVRVPLYCSLPPGNYRLLHVTKINSTQLYLKPYKQNQFNIFVINLYKNGYHITVNYNDRCFDITSHLSI